MTTLVPEVQIQGKVVKKTEVIIINDTMSKQMLYLEADCGYEKEGETVSKLGTFEIEFFGDWAMGNIIEVGVGDIVTCALKLKPRSYTNPSSGKTFFNNDLKGGFVTIDIPAAPMAPPTYQAPAGDPRQQQAPAPYPQQAPAPYPQAAPAPHQGQAPYPQQAPAPYPEVRDDIPF
jgi:hypothetical protein